jgi:hypothetical protein
MTDPQTPTQPTQDTTRPLSSREYIEQMRQRRQERRTEPAAFPQPLPIIEQQTAEPTIPEPPIQSKPYVEHPQEVVASPAPATPTPVPEQAAPQAPTMSETPTSAPAATPTSAETEVFTPASNKPIPEEIVFEWQAPSRPFKKRDRQYYTTIAAIVFLVSLILFFAGQLLPIAVVVSVGFLAYVLSSVPPEMIIYQVTTYGIRLENAFYSWDEMGRFWFEEKYGQPLMHIEIDRFPNRLTLMLGETTVEEAREIISEVLLEQKPQPTFFDKAATWLQEKIPLEVSNR